MSSHHRTYASESIEVQYELKRCIHAAECVKRLNEVFDSQKRPWIQPEHASADAIAQTIHHCPTGALHYTRKDGGADEPTPDANTLTIAADGPLYLRGDLQFVDGEGALVLDETRAALCRCGASKNKPFCDNSHKDAAFQDAGLLDLTREASEGEGVASGALQISPRPNGPVRVKGRLELHDAAGNTITRDEVFLCRCGHSANKPFCDGTHKTMGFTTD
jgi:CDGSH-type Zn-finger protein/uncharacterized Fe-S cluster protein YjdI